MNTNHKTEMATYSRRRFLSIAAASIGATESIITCAPNARSKEIPSEGARASEATSGASFSEIRQIDAGLLNVGYAEAGPVDGPAVVLLHGWPYDIHSFVDVAPLLASEGYRVIVPYVRGYGTTRFLSRETFRNGQQSVVALDLIELMDALRIRKSILAGFDWGARTADIVAALWPDRCKALVSVSGYLSDDDDLSVGQICLHRLVRLANLVKREHAGRFRLVGSERGLFGDGLEGNMGQWTIGRAERRAAKERQKYPGGHFIEKVRVAGGLNGAEEASEANPAPASEEFQ